MGCADPAGGVVPAAAVPGGGGKWRDTRGSRGPATDDHPDAGQATLAEGAGNTNIGVTATLSQVRASDTIVALSLGGDARATDYAIAGSLPRITIPANRTAGEATLLISAVNDIFFEATETVEVNGIAGNLLVIGASLVIEDDETQPSIRVRSIRATSRKERRASLR